MIMCRLSCSSDLLGTDNAVSVSYEGDSDKSVSDGAIIQLPEICHSGYERNKVDVILRFCAVLSGEIVDGEKSVDHATDAFETARERMNAAGGLTADGDTPIVLVFCAEADNFDYDMCNRYSIRSWNKISLKSVVPASELLSRWI
jgi:hypothetical protein